MKKNKSTETSNIPEYPNVKISVRNFGPITAADLDLRPLTVFVGPSNTGKTYLSVLIYALHRVFPNFPQSPLSPYLLSIVVDSLNRKLLEKIITKDQTVKISDLPSRARKKVQRALTDLDFFKTELKTELERCFDLESVSALMRIFHTQPNEMTISMEHSKKNQDLWNLDMKVSGSEMTLEGQVNEEMAISLKNWLPSTRSVSELDTLLTYQVLRFAHRGLAHRRSIGKPYYLPAARSGIMQSHRVIASSLVTRSTRAGLEALEVPTLSGVVADFMEKLILYEESAGPDDGIRPLADVLESDVLAGQIITKPSPTGYPEFLYRPQDMEEEIRLTRSSSMVSELAPFVLFLRGVISPGDTLIIEEPEAHLHPAAQTQMAATLARLVRAGVKVLVTTHSDFMLQEIGNLMRVGMLKEKGALKKETNDWLLPEEVGTWHFQKDQPVKEIQFDHTVGIEPEDYEDVVESLYNRWAGLQNQIEELKDESERER